MDSYKDCTMTLWFRLVAEEAILMDGRLNTDSKNLKDIEEKLSSIMTGYFSPSEKEKPVDKVKSFRKGILESLGRLDEKSKNNVIKLISLFDKHLLEATPTASIRFLMKFDTKKECRKITKFINSGKFDKIFGELAPLLLGTSQITFIKFNSTIDQEEIDRCMAQFDSDEDDEDSDDSDEELTFEEFRKVFNYVKASYEGPNGEVDSDDEESEEEESEEEEKKKEETKENKSEPITPPGDKDYTVGIMNYLIERERAQLLYKKTKEIFEKHTAKNSTDTSEPVPGPSKDSSVKSLKSLKSSNSQNTDENRGYVIPNSQPSEGRKRENDTKVNGDDSENKENVTKTKTKKIDTTIYRKCRDSALATD